MDYTLEYFRDKFQAIPENKWTRLVLNDSGRSCAIGHCGGYSSKEYHALFDLTAEKVREQVSTVNHLQGVEGHFYTVNDDAIQFTFQGILQSRDA